MLNTVKKIILDDLAQKGLEEALTTFAQVLRNDSKTYSDHVVISANYQIIKRNHILGLMLPKEYTDDIWALQARFSTLVHALEPSDLDIPSVERVLNLRAKRHAADLNLLKSENFALLFASIRQRQQELLSPDISLEKFEEYVSIRREILQGLFQVPEEKLRQLPHLRQLDIARLFHTLAAVADVQADDLRLVQEIRLEYRWYECSVIVSALTVGAMRFGDRSRLHLLIDFVTQAQDNVWQKALTGLVLCLSSFPKKVKGYKDLLLRLESLRSNLKVQNGLEIIDHILRKRLFQWSNILAEFGDIELHQLLDFLVGDQFVIPDDMSFFRQMLMENELLLFSPESIKENAFLSQPQNWFLPYYKDNEIALNRLKESGTDFDAADFHQILSESLVLTNLHKYFIALNIKQYDTNQVEYLLHIFQQTRALVQESVAVSKQVNEMLYWTCITELYLFFKFFPQDYLAEIFHRQNDLLRHDFIQHLLRDGQKEMILATRAMEIGEIDTAIDIYRRLGTVLSDDVIFLEKISIACEQRGQTEDRLTAIEFRSHLKRIQPANVDNIARMGFNYEMLGQPEMAWKIYQKAEKINDNYALLLNYLGYHAQLKKDYATAISYYQRAQKADKLDAESYRQMAYCLQNLEPPQFEAALEQYVQAVNIDKATSFVLVNMGYCHQSKLNPDFQAALECRLLAYQMEQDNMDNVASIGFCYQNLSVPDFEKALEYHERYYTFQKDNFWNLLQLGICCQNLPQPDFQRSLDFHLEAFDLEADDPFNLYQIGICYQNLPQPDFGQALRFHLACERHVPEDLANMSQIGHCYQNLTEPNFIEAEKYFQRIISINQNDAWALMQLANCLENIPPVDLDQTCALRRQSNQLFKKQLAENADYRDWILIHMANNALSCGDAEEARTYLSGDFAPKFLQLRKELYAYVALSEGQYDLAVDSFRSILADQGNQTQILENMLRDMTHFNQFYPIPISEIAKRLRNQLPPGRGD